MRRKSASSGPAWNSRPGAPRLACRAASGRTAGPCRRAGTGDLFRNNRGAMILRFKILPCSLWAPRLGFFQVSPWAPLSLVVLQATGPGAWKGPLGTNLRDFRNQDRWPPSHWPFHGACGRLGRRGGQQLSKSPVPRAGGVACLPGPGSFRVWGVPRASQRLSTRLPLGFSRSPTCYLVIERWILPHSAFEPSSGCRAVLPFGHWEFGFAACGSPTGGSSLSGLLRRWAWLARPRRPLWRKRCKYTNIHITATECKRVLQVGT
jgi:hypothetical protein